MSENNGNATLIFKVELINKQLKPTWGKDVPNGLLRDRALWTLIAEHISMILASQVNDTPVKSPIILNPKQRIPVGEAILDKIRRGI